MKINNSSIRRGAKIISLLLSTTTVLALAPGARADSPSDLMEQGIYSEETKGDLNGAVQLYQKVIAQAAADHALGAQAQYHLGMCFYKQKNYGDADTAFQALIKQYPDQTDLVAKARKYLAGAHPLQPAPWTDGEDMRLDINLSGGLKIGVADYRINAGQSTNGQKIWKCSAITVAGGMHSVSHVEVDADTFAPIHSRWKHTLLGDVDTVYYSDHADLKTMGKDDGVKKISFDVPVIDNEEAVQWMRRLPLAGGYTNNQAVLTSLGSHVAPITWTVSGPEKVEVPTGSYDCYKVDLSISQTFWYSADTNHYLVKFEGGGVVAELASVTHPAPNEQPTYTVAPFGVSLTAPPGWFFDRQDSDKKGTAGVTLVDPEGLTQTTVSLVTLDSMEPEEKKSLRDYAEQKIKAAGKMYAEYQPRAGGLQDREVAGQPGVSAVVDFTEGKNKLTAYGVWSFSPTNAVYFQMVAAPKDFAGMQKKLDAIVDSYKTP